MNRTSEYLTLIAKYQAQSYVEQQQRHEDADLEDANSKPNDEPTLLSTQNGNGANANINAASTHHEKKTKKGKIRTSESSSFHPFHQYALQIFKMIQSLQSYLHSSARAYIGHSYHSKNSTSILSSSAASQNTYNGTKLSSFGSSMMDDQRAELELKISNGLKMCRKSMDDLQEKLDDFLSIEEDDRKTTKKKQNRKKEQKVKKWNKENNENENKYQHFHAILGFLFDELKQLTESYSELRKKRMKIIKQEDETKNPKRFQIDPTVDYDKTVSKSKGSLSISEHNERGKDKSSNSAAEISTPDPNLIPPSTSNWISSPQTTQTLEQENLLLLESLSDHVTIAHQTEQQMKEITEMMTFFSTKVEEQEEQIHTIYDQNLQSTAHMERANVYLRSAVQRGVSARLLMMTTIFVLSFSLLILDWYYP